MRTMDGAYCELDLPPNGPVGAFADPVAVLVARTPEEVPGLLARVEALAAAGCWLPGFVAYEAAEAFDAALVGHEPDAGLPLAAFAAYRSSGAPRPRGEFMSGTWRDMTAPAVFESAIASIRADIAEGRFYQVNYTTRLRAPLLGDSAALFDALRASQPGAYSVYLDFGRWQVCSVSPELFFHWRPAASGVPPRLTLRPMKGTAPREADPAADRRAAEALRGSAKDRAENLMIVDLLRNDASRVAELGSVTVPSLFDVEPWATVWQMTSTVECRPRAAVGLPELFAALFPCGSVTGAPKAEAMRAIRVLEPAPRGVYCGAIGVVMPGGEARFNVGIRTVVVDGERGLAECGIGSGIVADSTMVGERDEWLAKERFLRRACPDYELFETLLWRRGRYWLLAEHLDRLGRSAGALGFYFDRAAVGAALDGAARGFAGGQWRVRLRLAMDGAIAIDSEPMARQHGPVVCALAARPVASGNPWLRHKTMRRDIYASLAVPDSFDTLLFNERGEATEFTRGNLVVKLGGRLLTPALDSGLLPGTFRAALLARGSIEEAVLPLGEVGAAERVWFVNSLRGALPVEFAR
ncbi:MAG: chorismate-binding protein [Rhodocyclales bacterium]|nr:chorismate-binding protein [Rhodocyclales bacterium]